MNEVPAARRGIRRAVVIGSLVCVVGVAVVVVVERTRSHRQAIRVGCRVASPAMAGTAAIGAGYSITPEQAQNAAIITAVGLRKGMPDHAVTIALATSLQETKLRNLPYGDRDSVGLFQQRPSQGWGTAAEIMDPNYAASAFYDHVVQVSGWQTMAVTEVAQLVQRSATPDAYAAWESEARSMAVALTGESAAGLSCRLAGFGGATPPASSLAQAATTELGSNLLGVPVATKVGWQVACWAVAHAYSYHLQSVSFGGRTWTASSGTWNTGTGSAAAPDVVTVAGTAGA